MDSKVGREEGCVGGVGCAGAGGKQDQLDLCCPKERDSHRGCKREGQSIAGHGFDDGILRADPH